MKRKWGEEQTKRKGNSVDKKGERRKGKKKNEYRERGRKGEKKKGDFFRRFEGRISTVRELNSIHATRATHGNQNLGVSSNSKR